MFIENRKVSNSWKIIFIECSKPKDDLAKEYAVFTRFETVSPENKTNRVLILFTEEFVWDYPCKDIKLMKNTEELFKKWSLVRIGECLSKGAIKGPIKITSADFQWSEKIDKSCLPSTIQQQDNSTYIYIPERRIGF